MNKLKISCLFFMAAAAVVPPASADSAGSSAGLTLLRDGGARSSALGEAFTSMTNDITAMEFNPASLATLESGQASLQYEKGFFDDSFSKAMLGMRSQTHGTVGLSLGYYNSGKTTLYDGVSTQQSVTAEQDRVAGLGYGFQRQAFSYGASVRYLWSSLAEANTGSAASVDVGLQYHVSTRFQLGVAGPLLQSKLNYAHTDQKLPKVYRAGMSWTSVLPLPTGDLPMQFLFDVPYDATAHVTALALGAETHFGILALRAGYNTSSDIQQFSIGAGFQFQRMNLDYSFGMVENSNINSLHKVTFSFRFNDARSNMSATAPALSKAPVDNGSWALSAPAPASSVDQTQYKVYEVKEGETLESIALSRYGSAANWQDIYAANRHVYSSPDQIKSGSIILLPAKKGS